MGAVTSYCETAAPVAFDAEDTESPQHHIKGDVAPFHLNIKILNKTEVIQNKIKWLIGGSALLTAPLAYFTSDHVISDDMFASRVAQKLSDVLPAKAMEKAGIKLSLLRLESACLGTSFVVQVRIESFNLVTLAMKGLKLSSDEAQQFADAYNGVEAALAKMDMVDKWEDVDASVGKKVRWKVMVRLAEALPIEISKEPTCLKVNLDIPELLAETPPQGSSGETQPEVSREMSITSLHTNCLETLQAEPFLVHAEVHDRHALLSDRFAQEHTPLGMVKKVVGGVVSDEVFERILEQKLKHQLPEALHERAGIQSLCERVRRKHRPEELSKNGVLVQVTLKAFDSWPPVTLLAKSKGSEFAAGFTNLWQHLKTLERLGIPGIHKKMGHIVELLIERVRKGIQTKLTDALAERLHATVRALDITQDGVEEIAKSCRPSDRVSPSRP